MSDQLTADGAGESGRVPDRRLLLVGALVASLLLGGGAFLLTGSEEAVDEVAFTVPRRPVLVVTPTPTPSASTSNRHAEPINPFLAQVRDLPGSGAPTLGTPAAPDPGAIPGPTAPPPTDGGFRPGDGLPTDGLPTLPVAPPVDPPVEPPVDPPVEPPVPTLPADPTSAPRPTPPGTPTPTTPVVVRHTLELRKVTGTAPDLRGHFLLDGELVPVSPSDDAGGAFGPADVLTLLGLEETGSGWAAVVQVGTATPVNLPVGKVLRFG